MSKKTRATAPEQTDTNVETVTPTVTAPIDDMLVHTDEIAPTSTEPTGSTGRRYVVIDVTGAQEERIAALLTESNAILIAPDLPASPRAIVALIECLDVLSPIADSLLGAAKDALARKIGTGKTVQIGGRKAYAAKMSGKARRHEWTMRYEAEREAMDLDG